MGSNQLLYLVCVVLVATSCHSKSIDMEGIEKALAKLAEEEMAQEEELQHQEEEEDIVARREGRISFAGFKIIEVRGAKGGKQFWFTGEYGYICILDPSKFDAKIRLMQMSVKNLRWSFSTVEY